MPPKPSETEGADPSEAITVDDIASVAANSVNGFLTNVARGVRRAQAEGGKGTRRRVELYISTDLPKAKAAEAKSEGGDNKASVVVGPPADGQQPAAGDDGGNNALFPFSADGETEDDPFAAFGDDDGGDWDEYDLDADVGDFGDAVCLDGEGSSSLLKGEGAAKAETGNTKTEESSAAQPQRPAAAAAFVKAEGADPSAPPAPPLPPSFGAGGGAHRDPAYEQMMADHAAAAERARQLRLAALRRTVNKTVASILKGKLVDRWASSGGLLLRALLPEIKEGERSANSCGGCCVAAERRRRIRAAVDAMRVAVAPLFPSRVAGDEKTALPPHGVKATHAPMWLTAEQAHKMVAAPSVAKSEAKTVASPTAPPSGNPFTAALGAFVAALAGGKSSPASSSKVGGDVGAAAVGGVFALDADKWGTEFVAKSHCVSDSVGPLVAFVNAQLSCQHCCGDGAEEEGGGETVVGKKRPRCEDSAVDNDTRTSVDYSCIVFDHPHEYVACVLALLRAAGVPSRLAAAVESPPPPAEAVVSLDGSGDDSGDEAGMGDGADTGGEGGHLAVLWRLAAAAGAANADAAPAAGKSAGKAKNDAKKGGAAAKEAAYVPPPCSHFWVEVYDPLRQAVVSVNPIAGLTTRFGAPYTFAFFSEGEQRRQKCEPAVGEKSVAPPNAAEGGAAGTAISLDSDCDDAAADVPSPREDPSYGASNAPPIMIVSETVTDVTPRYAPKYSAVFPRRLDRHCRPYRRLLWHAAFYNIKDYEEDRRYGPTAHVVVMLNAMLRGEYTFDCGTRGAATDVTSPSSTGAAEGEGFVPPLAPLIAALDEEDAAQVVMVFGGAQLADECVEGGGSTSALAVAPSQCASNPDSSKGAAAGEERNGEKKGAEQRFCGSWRSEYAAREATQLEKLLYAEPAPATLADAKGHPLYVLERDVGRHEAVYPKDKTTIVGAIRGALVFKRTAVVALRSRDGWLREGRAVMTAAEAETAAAAAKGKGAANTSAAAVASVGSDASSGGVLSTVKEEGGADCPSSDNAAEEGEAATSKTAAPSAVEGTSLELVQPYRVVPPPPSRPLAPPSKFYGYWQTKPFAPQGLTSRGAIPRHGNTNWYMLLGAPLPPTLARLTEPVAAAVARRVNIEYRQAIVGFDKREWAGPGAGWGRGGGGSGGGGRGGGGGGRGGYSGFGGGYDARAEGIVIKKVDEQKCRTAMAEYVAMLEAQEQRRRSQRARNWWNAFAQRLLANDRMHAMFLRGNAL